jgi:hypothetical protein
MGEICLIVGSIITGGMIESARLIAELGVLVVLAAAYIYTSLKNQKTLTEIKNLQTQNVTDMSQLKEAMTGEVYRQVRVVARYSFVSNKFNVLMLIDDIKRNNHLDNKTYIEGKVKRALDNLYDDRKENFDAFFYRGKKLSYYVEEVWKNDIYEFCLRAVYDEKPFDIKNYINTPIQIFFGFCASDNTIMCILN